MAAKESLAFLTLLGQITNDFKMSLHFALSLLNCSSMVQAYLTVENSTETDFHKKI